MKSISNIIPVFMCGGAGIRLWPLSTPEKPKTFVSMEYHKNGLQHMLELCDDPLFSTPTIIGNAKHLHLIKDSLTDKKAHIITEFSVRNTCATITLASLFHQHNEDRLLLLLPTDIRFTDKQHFLSAVQQLVENLSTNQIGTLGIKPLAPSSQFGYISSDTRTTTPYRVKQFHEKPDSITAQRYINENMLWNSGTFLFSSQDMLSILGQYQPDVLARCKATFNTQTNTTSSLFNEVPSISFDKAIMEKHDNIIVQPYLKDWYDLGTWQSLNNYFSTINYPATWKNTMTINLTNDTVTANNIPVVKYTENHLQHIGYYQSPIGTLKITEEDGAIISIAFSDETIEAPTPPSLAPLFTQLDEYFAGTRTQFDVKISQKGTNFQQHVWKTLCNIPFGDTTSYGAIAQLINNPKASRAVGMANNKNHLPIIIPCHRVVGASGKLVGYAGGLERKSWLLEHEMKILQNHSKS